MLSAETELHFADSSRIRFLGKDEANSLAEMILKRNVFARHSRENNFYLQRAQELANRTVIEVFRPGDPQDMAKQAEETADLIEKLAVLSSTLAMPKDDLQRRLGISSRIRTEVDFIIGHEFRYLRSRSRPAGTPRGIMVDERFRQRFSRCGFHELYTLCFSSDGLSKRVNTSLNWLFESRREPRLPAAVVKTAIALESLLIFSESESLARSLSERAAFILSSKPDIRQRISKVIKRFYNARSGVVHGSQRKLKSLVPSLVEGVDRLCVLLYLVLAANDDLWPATEIPHWCERERWGAPSTEVQIPFSATHLRNALVLSEKGS